MSSSSGNPPYTDLWLERSLFAGTAIGAATYGMHVLVFCTTYYFMFRAPPKQKMATWQFIYVFVMFALGTFEIAGNVKFYEKMWIDERNILGGPFVWVTKHFGDPVNTFANAADATAILLQDSVLLYRLLVIWNFNYLIAVAPVMALITSTILSVFTVIQSAKPNTGSWGRSALAVAVPYCALSISLNLFMTLAIVARMAYMRKRVRDVLGSQHSRMYTSVAAMFIESGAVYSVVGLTFLVSYAMKSNVQNIFLQALQQAVCISTELIMLRVALGRAWSRDTTVPTLKLTTIECATPSLGAAMVDTSRSHPNFSQPSRYTLSVDLMSSFHVSEFVKSTAEHSDTPSIVSMEGMRRLSTVSEGSSGADAKFGGHAV